MANTTGKTLRKPIHVHTRSVHLSPDYAPASAAAQGQPTPVWHPRQYATTSAIGAFAKWIGERFGESFADYRQLWAWSVRDPGRFWDTIWSYCNVQGSRTDARVLVDEVMPGASWFPSAELNFAENVFHGRDDAQTALIEVGEAGAVRECTWRELRRSTGAFAEYLHRCGVQPGDRVAGYMPSCIEAVVGFLACASVGAIWSICNFDLAVDAVIDRFRQLEPVVLLVTHRSTFAGAVYDRRADANALRNGLPSVRAAVVVAHDGTPTGYDFGDWLSWDDAVAIEAPLRFHRVRFSHPLWVLFSSGTTGPPKGFVHGHGGVLLEMKKVMTFHFDVREGDRFFWHSSTSWVMWNIVVSSLLVGACAVLYDGSPTHPNTDRLWQIAAQHRVDILGVGAAYLIACEQAGLRPRDAYPLETVRMIGSTGSVLPPSTYYWVRDAVSAAPLNSSSGGTDVASSFIGWNPMLPVHAGEIAGPCLGVAVEAWSEDGESVVDRVGELVVTKPMPSMPTQFWNDPDDCRYRAAYFDRHQGIWCHGDLITATRRGTFFVHGRSDATLNRNGVRLGSAEIYRALGAISEVVDSLAVGVELPDGGYWMPLFVQLTDDRELDDGLRGRIADAIRRHASSRHVPDEILHVPGIPHTATGKRLEVPIKEILLGAEPADVLNLGTIDDPRLLQPFVEMARTLEKVSRPAIARPRSDPGHAPTKPGGKTP